MLINEIKEYMGQANSRYDIVSAKIEAYCEAVSAQLAINCKKAELKVMQESGTVEDLQYLEEGAAADAVEKLKAAIDKIIEAFKKFVNEVKLRILTLISKAEIKSNLEKIQKKIRFNPFLSKKKVQVENTEKELKAVAEGNSLLQKLISKIKSGAEVAIDEVEDVAAKVEAKIREAGGVKASIKMTLGNAVNMLKKTGDNIGDQIDKFKKISLDLIDQAKGAAGKMHEAVAPVLRMIASKASAFGHEAVNAIVNGWTTTLSIIRGAISKVKGKADGGEGTTGEGGQGEETTAEESAWYDDDFMDSVSSSLFEEESESDRMLRDIEDDLFSESSYNDYDSDIDDFMSSFDDLF